MTATNTKFFKGIMNTPSLEVEEETALWETYFSATTFIQSASDMAHGQNDETQLKLILMPSYLAATAKKRIIESHLKLCLSKAQQKHRASNLPLMDLFSEAQAGMLYAFDKYEFGHKARFNTYARWWIRSSLDTYELDNISYKRLTKTHAVQHIHNHYRNYVARLKRTNPNMSQHELDLSFAEHSLRNNPKLAHNIDRMMRQIESYKATIASRHLSLNDPIKDNVGAEFSERGSLIASDAMSPHDLTEQADLKNVLGSLLEEFKNKSDINERAMRIFSELHLNPERRTLGEMGKAHGISHERVRQIGRKTYEKFLEFSQAKLNIQKPSSKEKSHGCHLN